MFTLDNQFVRQFTAAAREDGPPRAVAESHAWTQATPVSSPKLLAYSHALAGELGLAAADVESNAFLQCFSGNQLLPGMRSWAYNYGGHQFGHWAGQLGDGRALSLAEVLTPSGGRAELQLKGAGHTPFSRHADGRAVLRSSLREYICSEAMHALGVPTTRALCLIATGEDVERDMFYTGDRRMEPGAIVCRVAPSFLRFGHFELPSARGDVELLRALLDFCIARDFAHLDGTNRHADFFADVCMRTAVMIAHWMRIGFVHGVMNTDNMSILGLTLDYGPYGWLEPFDPGWTPNTTDAQGKRYCYGRQAEIGHWNLAALAQALAPVIDHGALQAGLQAYVQTFNAEHQRHNRNKLGLEQLHDGDQALLQDWFQLLQNAQLDFTLSFRALHALDASQASLDAVWRELLACSDADALAEPLRAETLRWLERYQARIAHDDAASRQLRMQAANPLYVPRNYLAQIAIDAATAGDTQPLLRWQRVLENPYQFQAGADEFAGKRPLWARERAGCSMLSCSS
jgi:serine/tyrosine/threonine adenylyltransferase